MDTHTHTHLRMHTCFKFSIVLETSLCCILRSPEEILQYRIMYNGWLFLLHLVAWVILANDFRDAVVEFWIMAWYAHEISCFRYGGICVLMNGLGCMLFSPRDSSHTHTYIHTHKYTHTYTYTHIHIHISA